MADFFALFGIAIAVLFADVVVCLLQVTIAGAWKEKDWWLIPLITNAIGLAISLSFHIFNWMR